MSSEDVPLQQVLAGAVSDCYEDIRQAVETCSKEDGQLTPHDRTLAVLQALHSTRQRLLRLLPLVRWSSQKAVPVAHCKNVPSVAEWHSKELTTAADRLCHIAPELEMMSQPAYDAPTAWEVMTEGTMKSLPTAIRELAGHEAEAGGSDAARRLDMAVRSELVRCGVPQGVRLVGVKDGRATLECPGKYTAEITLAPYQPPPQLGRSSESTATIATWNLEALKIHVATPLSDVDENHVGTRLAISRIMLDTAVAASAAARGGAGAAGEGAEAAGGAGTAAGPTAGGLSNGGRPGPVPTVSAHGPAPSVDSGRTVGSVAPGGRKGTAGRPGGDAVSDPATSALLAMHGALHEIAVGLAFANVANSGRALCHPSGPWGGALAFDALSPAHPEVFPGIQVSFWLNGPWRAWAGPEAPPRLEIGITKEGREGVERRLAQQCWPQPQPSRSGFLGSSSLPPPLPGTNFSFSKSLRAAQGQLAEVPTTCVDVQPLVLACMAEFGASCLRRVLDACEADDRWHGLGVEGDVTADPTSGRSELSLAPSTSSLLDLSPAPLLRIVLGHSGRVAVPLGPAAEAGRALQPAALQAVARSCQLALNHSLDAATDPARLPGVLAGDIISHVTALSRHVDHAAHLATASSLGLHVAQGAQRAAVLAAAAASPGARGDAWASLFSAAADALVLELPSPAPLSKAGTVGETDRATARGFQLCRSHIVLFPSAYPLGGEGSEEGGSGRGRGAAGEPGSSLAVLVHTVQGGRRGAAPRTSLVEMGRVSAGRAAEDLAAVRRRALSLMRRQELRTSLIQAGFQASHRGPDSFDLALPGGASSIHVKLLSDTEGTWEASLELDHGGLCEEKGPAAFGPAAMHRQLGPRTRLEYSLSRGGHPVHFWADLSAAFRCEALYNAVRRSGADADAGPAAGPGLEVRAAGVARLEISAEAGQLSVSVAYAGHEEIPEARAEGVRGPLAAPLLSLIREGQVAAFTAALRSTAAALLALEAALDSSGVAVSIDGRSPYSRVLRCLVTPEKQPGPGEVNGAPNGSHGAANGGAGFSGGGDDDEDCAESRALVDLSKPGVIQVVMGPFRDRAAAVARLKEAVGEGGHAGRCDAVKQEDGMANGVAPGGPANGNGNGVGSPSGPGLHGGSVAELGRSGAVVRVPREAWGRLGEVFRVWERLDVPR